MARGRRGAGLGLKALGGGEDRLFGLSPSIGDNAGDNRAKFGRDRCLAWPATRCLRNGQHGGAPGSAPPAIHIDIEDGTTAGFEEPPSMGGCLSDLYQRQLTVVASIGKQT
jgi:hypothetical protein